MNKKGLNIALLKSIEVIALDQIKLRTSCPNPIEIRCDQIEFLNGAMFENVPFNRKDTKYNEKEQRTRYGWRFDKVLKTNILNLDVDVMKFMRRYRNRKLMLRITDVNGICRLVYPVRIAGEKCVQGVATCGNKELLQFSGASPYESPIVV